MKFSYNWLQDYIVGKMPEPKKLVEVLTLHSFEVESMVRVKNDWVLDIVILPNRAHDCFSHLGVAQEIAAIINSKFQTPTPKFLEDKNLKASDFVAVEVENKEDCPRYTAKVITDVKVKGSPKWMQERLLSCGLQPINNIVDATNYVMLETGQPLHAFDFGKIKSSKAQGQNPKVQLEFKKIIVRRARGGEKIKTLDSRIYELNKDILVIADEREPIAIAGIKGGFSTGIDERTKTLIIEGANFNQTLARRASQKLKLRTDASVRFEHGADPNLIDFAQKRVCSLIQEMSGGKTARGMVDFYPQKLQAKKIKFDLDYVEKLLGLKIPKQKILDILKRLGLRAKEVIPPSIVLVEVPTRRLDISFPEDVVEEIGRIYGYEKIPSLYPQTTLVVPARNDEIFWENVCKDILKGVGFSEAYNYSFIGEQEKEVFGWADNNLLEIENPISSFNKYLRPSLVPNLLKNIKENLRWFNEIKIFEIGQVFKRVQGAPRAEKKFLGRRQKPKAKSIEEKKMLGVVLTGKGIKDDGFYELKGVIETLLNGLGITEIWYNEYQPTAEDSKLSHWHPAKCAEIKIGTEEVGFLGELHPQLVEEVGVKERSFSFELDLEKIFELASEENEYQPIPSYPASSRDLSILVPQGTKTVEILNVIYKAGGSLVKDVDLFDIYSGGEIIEGKESLAFHIIYQAKDKTLSSKEVDGAHQKIIKALEENVEWQVRK